MTAAVVEREIRCVRVGNTAVPLGALAGTDVAHRFKPDETSGTSCLLCFGWYDDYRHAARQRAVV